MGHEISRRNDLIKRKYYLADYSVMGFPSAYDILGEPYVTYTVGAAIHPDQDIERALDKLEKFSAEQINFLIHEKSESEGIPKGDIVIHWRELPNFCIDREDRVKMSYRCTLHHKQPQEA